MKITFASSFSQKEAMKVWRELAIERGHVVLSSWLDSEYTTDAEATPMELIIAAEKAICEIVESDYFIFDSRLSTHKLGSGGRHFELGVAYASNIPVLLVGQPESAFHHLPCFERCHSISQALDVIGNRSSSPSPRE